MDTSSPTSHPRLTSVSCGSATARDGHTGSPSLHSPATADKKGVVDGLSMGWAQDCVPGPNFEAPVGLMKKDRHQHIVKLSHGPQSRMKEHCSQNHHLLKTHFSRRLHSQVRKEVFTTTTPAAQNMVTVLLENQCKNLKGE